MLINNRYEKIELIGKGTFGNIYKVLDIETNNFYALKLIKIDKNDELKNLEKEIEVMKNIKNKYIMELKDNFYDKIEQF